MEEPTNESTNPTKPGEDEPISENLAGNEGQGETKPANDGTDPAKPETPKPTMSPEMQQTLKRLLRETNRGKGLMVRLDSLARPDLYKNSVNVNWVKDIQSIDVTVRPYDLNPGLFEQFRSYCWNNAMTYRFDDTAGQLVLVVRWFLPDALPAMDPNLNAFGMMKPEPPKEPETPAQAKPDLKEVK